MADPKHYIRQGSIDDENFLYLARKLGHHLNALNVSIENLDTSGTYNDLKKEIEDLKSVVEAIEEYDDTELREELQSLKEAIDAIEDYDDTELKESLYNLQDDISRLDGYLTQLNTSVTNIKTAANNHYTLYDSAIEGIHESLNDLEEQISNLNLESYNSVEWTFTFNMQDEIYSNTNGLLVLRNRSDKSFNDYVSATPYNLQTSEYLRGLGIQPVITNAYLSDSGCVICLQVNDPDAITDFTEILATVSMRILLPN